MSLVVAGLFVFAVSCATGLLVTPRARTVGLRMGLVATPTADRWHQCPTALLGGVAIVLATLVGVGIWTAVSALQGRPGGAPVVSLQSAAVVMGAVFMFAVGLIDDIVNLRPQLKFILQTLAGVGLVGAGATLSLTPWYVVNVVATVFWFVALTNAFNLLDNMDGVAAGVGAIAAFFLGVTFAQQGAWWHTALAWSLAGAAVAFLRYNFQPASIFMGDAGSLFIGSVLAGLVVTSPASASGSLVSVLFVPLAIVAVPIADTALVTVTRTLAARSISQGGRDHSTHRLVALGLHERQVALLLYAFAALGGCVGLVLMRLDLALGLVLGTAFFASMSLIAAYLGRLKVGHAEAGAGSKAATLLVTQLLYKKRLAEMLLDVLLVTGAYYGAYRLKFEGGAPPAYMAAFESTVGLVIAVKISAFGLLGVYRGAWRYTGLEDLYRILGAIILSSAALFGYVRLRVPVLADSNILYIDLLLTAAFVLTSRLSFRSLEMARSLLHRTGERILIYGAGDAGELALRELLNNAGLRLQPVCFLDDDARKHGARIHGVPVAGGIESLALVVERYDVHRILIGTKKLTFDARRALQAYAACHGLELFELDLGVRAVPGDGARADMAAVGPAPAQGPVLHPGVQVVANAS